MLLTREPISNPLIMNNFQALDTQTLIDLLMEQTNLYTSKMLAKDIADIEQQKITIIMEELRSRNQIPVSINIGDPSFNKFTSGTN